VPGSPSDVSPSDVSPGTVSSSTGSPGNDAPTAAQAFADLFSSTYLQFHRRDGKRADLSAASRAVLQHLALAGPLTIGEAARHLDRAQSVVSDIVTQLEGKGLLEREPDPTDRRRTFVWLTPEGLAVLARDREVLSTELLTRAMACLTPAERTGLLEGARALLAADLADPADPAPVPTHPRIPRKDAR
jgi:DNA-binding MarR family transcriptional regulator